MPSSVDIFLEHIQLGLGDPHGCGGGEGGLDTEHGLPQFEETHLLQNHRCLHAVRNFRMAWCGDEQPLAAGSAAQHTALLEYANGLSHSRAVDSERLRQCRLRRKRRPDRQFAIQNSLADGAGDAPIDRHRLAQRRIQLRLLNHCWNISACKSVFVAECPGGSTKQWRVLARAPLRKPAAKPRHARRFSTFRTHSLPELLSDNFRGLGSQSGIFVNLRSLDKDEHPDIVRQSNEINYWEEMPFRPCFGRACTVTEDQSHSACDL